MNSGKILIQSDAVLAREVQERLFAEGYTFQDGSTDFRPGKDMFGICFTADYRTTTRNKKSIRYQEKLIAWTSKPDVFRSYSVPVVSADMVLVERPVAQMV